MEQNMGDAPLAAAARGDIGNAIIASTPGGIERQEAEGQRVMASNFRTLPKDMDRAPAEAFGFEFGEDADDIFVSVKAPEGWSIRPTDHSMHSDIVDARGRKRGSIFYKAAFYDRSANGHWTTRYGVEREYDSDYTATAAKVIDRATGETLFLVPVASEGGDKWERQDAADKAATEWLADAFPDHRDVTAYW